MNKFIFRFGLLTVVLITVLLFIPQAKAEDSEGGFTLSGIDAQVVVNNDASFVVTETITGEFQEERHGIFRDLPRSYKNNWVLHKITPIEVLKVTKNGQPEPYELFPNGSYLTVKIGDPEKTSSGPFVYIIEYKVSRAMLYQEDGQANWYWNVAEDEWGTPVGKVTATIVMPDGLKNISSECWGGTYLVDDQTCEIFLKDKKITSSSDNLLTVSVKFKPGDQFYVPSQEDNIKIFLQDNWDLGFLLMPLILILVLFLIWRKFGHDPHGRGTIVAEYDPPDDLSPAEISALVYSGLNNRSITAMIISLAVKGYLQIEESDQGINWMPGLKYKLIKLKEADDKLQDFEKELLVKIFGDKKEQILAGRKSELVKAKITIDSLVWGKMLANDYFPHDPYKIRSWYFGIGGGMMALNILIGFPLMGISDRYLLAASLFIMMPIFFIFAPFMSRRSQKGSYAAEKAKGFKLFLETAEKYRLQWQEREGIFEKFLPYAIVFGIADKWAKTFAGLLQESPRWYVGSTSMNFASFSSSLNSFVSISNSVSTPSSGGSGSSGGGFGGGGGGSW